jgi:nitrogen regulatory protein P-II 1
MKKIEAVIQPFRIREVQQALEEAGVGGMTVTDVLGHGRQKGHTEIYRGQEYETGLHPKVKIEVAVSDCDVEAVVSAIIGAARTGKIGDGKIFVMDMLEAIRIRNGNINEAAV